MNSLIESEQFDVRHEEDSVPVTQIKTEPQDLEYEIKTEAKGYNTFLEDVDVKHECETISHLAPFVETELQVKETQESLDKLVEDNESKLRGELKNTGDDGTNVVPVSHDTCDVYATYLQEQKCAGNTVEKTNCNPTPGIYTQSTERCFTYNGCNKSFSMKLSIVSNTDENQYKCKVCSKSYSYKHHLSRHVRTHGKQFSGKLTRRNAKTFKCDMCRKSFTHKYSLIAHIRLHTNEKPYKCHLCSKSFAQKSNVASHTRTHTKEKPFRCDICSKSFSYKSYLPGHIRTHAKEKSLKCDICSRSFLYKSHLPDHMCGLTKKKLFKYIICSKSCYANHICTCTQDPLECNICSLSFSN